MKGLGGQVKILSTNWLLQNSHGEVKYSIGNGVAKELICMTHGHEQWLGIVWGSGGCWMEGGNEKKIGTTVIA